LSTIDVAPDDLSLLIRVAELGSFSAVARERGLPTSSISRAVQRLEKTWQVRLLRRSTHGLSVTPEGSLAIELGRQSLATLRDLSERLARPTEEVSGTVRLALSAAFAESIVVPALPRLAERHPALCIELLAEDQATNLSAAGVDLALRTGKVVDEDLVARQIGHFRRGLYCSVDYVRRRGLPRRPEALVEHDLIGHLAARNLNRFLLNIDGKAESWEIRGR
jgi:DNA-binding transcriptional LysR family regulator